MYGVGLMKTMFKSIFTWLACLGILGSAEVASANEYWTTRDLLADHFKASERVTYLRITPSGDVRAHIEARLGRPLPKASYTFFVAQTHDKLDGYALFDEQVGQHEPISFATFFDVEGHVTRVEVVAYHEPYGDGIRSARFRQQFIGRSVQSRFAPGSDIDAISGATISSRAICVGVERAAVLFSETILKQTPAVLAAR
jgi:electron transport complex protein RnfG